MPRSSPGVQAHILRFPNPRNPPSQSPVAPAQRDSKWQTLNANRTFARPSSSAHRPESASNLTHPSPVLQIRFHFPAPSIPPISWSSTPVVPAKVSPSRPFLSRSTPNQNRRNPISIPLIPHHHPAPTGPSPDQDSAIMPRPRATASPGALPATANFRPGHPGL
jgi:hypothetical protein